MKRITILLVLAALLAVPAGALSVKKKSIRRVAQNAQVTTTTTTTNAAASDYYKAIRAYENDELDLAERLMKKHLSKTPNDADAWVTLGGIYGENNMPEQALEALNRARQCRIDPNDTELLNLLYYTRSGVDLQLNDTQSAIDDLSMALRYDPSDVYSYFRRANLYNKLKRYDEALVDYGMIVQYEPEELQGYLGIGTVSGSLKNRPAAIRAYTKAIQIEPERAESYALRAVEYYNDEDYEKSAKDIISALERDRDNARALWVLDYIKEDMKEDKDTFKEVTKIFKDKAKKSKDPSWLDLLR